MCIVADYCQRPTRRQQNKIVKLLSCLNNWTSCRSCCTNAPWQFHFHLLIVCQLRPLQTSGDCRGDLKCIRWWPTLMTLTFAASNTTVSQLRVCVLGSMQFEFIDIIAPRKVLLNLLNTKTRTWKHRPPVSHNALRALLFYFMIELYWQNLGIYEQHDN